MRTAYCPKGHTELGSASKGNEYGHVPGHHYLDVDVVISHVPGKTVRCHVVETWGSAQGRGCDEEHGRREVIGRALTIEGACSDALYQAQKVGMGEEYLFQAISKARDEAEEALAE